MLLVSEGGFRKGAVCRDGAGSFCSLSALVSSPYHYLRDVCIDLERQVLLYPLEFVAGHLLVGYISVVLLGH